MSVIKCDTDRLNGEVKSSLNSATSILEEGANIISTIDIPSSFSMKGELGNIPNSVHNTNNEIENLKKWVSDVVNKFTNAENSNKSIINQLKGEFDDAFSNSFSSNIKSTNESVNLNTDEKQKQFEIIVNDLCDMIKSDATVVKKNDLQTLVADGFDSILNIASDISDKVNDFVSNPVESINKSMSVYYTNILKPQLDFLADLGKGIADVGCTIVASVGNAILALLKGVLELLENLVDFVIIVGGAAVTLVVGLIEAIVTIPMIFDEDFGTWVENLTSEGLAAQIMKGTMSVVSTQVVNGLYDQLYDTAFGKWMDEHSIGALRSDGIVYEFVTGVGYTIGIIVLTLLTLGAGTAAAAAGSGAALSTDVIAAVIAFAAGTGKYTEQKWVELKSNSWSEFEEKYKNGEISEDLYNYVVEIRKMSDEEWENTKVEILNQAENREEAEYTIEMLENYRNLTEGDWRTAENFGKGITYGTLNGAWEGLQWYVGGKLSGINVNSRLLKASINVGSDALFNGADTFARAGIDSLTFGEDFGEAFENNGGWGSVAQNLIIGFIFSAGSEFIDFKTSTKTKVQDTNDVLFESPTSINMASSSKGINDQLEDVYDYFFKGNKPSQYVQDIAENVVKIVDASGLLKNVDDSVSKKVINELIENCFDGRINPADIQSSHIKQAISLYEYWENIKYADLTTLSDQKILDLFNLVFSTGYDSDKGIVNVASNAFKEAMNNGVSGAKEILQTLIKVKIDEPKIHFELTDKGAHWYNGDFVLRLTDVDIKRNDIGTFEHELGHLLWDMSEKTNLPNNWDSIIKSAKKNAEKGKFTINDSNNYISNLQKNMYKKATDEMDNFVKSMGYSKIDDYVDYIASRIQSFWNSPTPGNIKVFLKNLGMSDDAISIILQNQNASFKDMANMYVNQTISEIKDRITRIEFPGYTAFSDIVDAVFMGKKTDGLGNKIFVTYQHGENYYSKQGSWAPFLQFHELIANFNLLKLQNDTTNLKLLKDLFGKELYDTLDDTFNKFIKNGNIEYKVDSSIKNQVEIIAKTLFDSKPEEISSVLMKKICDGIYAVKNTKILDALGKNEGNNVLVRVIDDLLSNKISVDKINTNYVLNTLSNYVDEIVSNFKQSLGMSGVNRIYDSKYIKNETINLLGLDKSTKYRYTADLNFGLLQGGTGTYGIDQGVFRELKNDRKEYKEMKNWIKNTYNLSSKDSAKMMELLDSIGACSYADASNEILLNFAKNKKLQDLFESHFGFPLIEVLPDGKLKVNDKKLLMDLFLTVNDTQYGGFIVKTLPDGTKEINWDQVEKNKLKLKNQLFMQNVYGMNKNLIDKYLSIKNIKSTYETNTLKIMAREIDENFMDNLIDEIGTEMEKGNIISMYINSKNGPIRLIESDGSSKVVLDGNGRNGQEKAHAIIVTGISDIGFIVSSWGKKMIIPFEDLMKGGFSVFSSIIK